MFPATQLLFSCVFAFVCVCVAVELSERRRRRRRGTVRNVFRVYDHLCVRVRMCTLVCVYINCMSVSS